MQWTKNQKRFQLLHPTFGTHRSAHIKEDVDSASKDDDDGVENDDCYQDIEEEGEGQCSDASSPDNDSENKNRLPTI